MSDAKFGCSSKRWAAVLSSRLKGGGVVAAVLSAGAGGWNSVGLPATVDFAAFWATARGRRARARRIFGLWLRLRAYAAVVRALGPQNFLYSATG